MEPITEHQTINQSSYAHQTADTNWVDQYQISLNNSIP